jgi:heat shock protein HslJ
LVLRPDLASCRAWATIESGRIAHSGLGPSGSSHREAPHGCPVAKSAGSFAVFAGPAGGDEWRLADYLGREGALVRVPEDVIATAQFAGGTVSGATGCNRYHAPCRVDGDRLAVASIAMTMMACEPERNAVESAFMSAFEGAASFAIAGDALELADADFIEALAPVDRRRPYRLAALGATTAHANRM